MTEDRKPEGMTEVSAKFAHEAEADDLLAALAVDYYAMYIAHDAATNAREEAWGEAMKLDREATCVDVSPLVPNIVQLGSLFEDAGTLTPTREQVFQCVRHEGSDQNKFTDVVMRHLEQYCQRCIAAFEAAGWPESQAEFERTKQRKEALFDQMVQTPAQGLRGIAAKVKGLVFPHEWEFLRDGKLDDFDDQINTDMLVSLVVDVERMAGEGAVTRIAATTPAVAGEARLSSARQNSPLDVETIAINIETVVATLQMAIEGLPNDGRVGDIPDVLALCRNHLSDQQQKLEEIVEGGRARP